MKKVVGSKILKVMVALAIVAGLVCAMALPAMAKDTASGKSVTASVVKVNTLKGKLESKDDDGKSFNITDKNGDVIPILVDDNTKFFLVNAAPFAAAVREKVNNGVQNFKDNRQSNTGNKPNVLNQRGLGNKNGQPKITAAADINEEDELDLALESQELEQGFTQSEQGPRGIFGKIKSWFGSLPRFGQPATFGDLETGDGIIARVMPNENLAKQVLIISPSNIKKISGLVQEVNVDSFAVNPETGDNVTLAFNADTQVKLKGAIAIADGQWARVVYKALEDDNLAMVVDILLEKPAPKPTLTTDSGT